MQYSLRTSGQRSSYFNFIIREYDDNSDVLVNVMMMMSMMDLFDDYV